jgi:hypothetical protein
MGGGGEGPLRTKNRCFDVHRRKNRSYGVHHRRKRNKNRLQGGGGIGKLKEEEERLVQR